MMREDICPHCKNPINDSEAFLCHFCGESLERAVGVFGKLRSAWGKWFAALVALVIVLSFLFSMVR